jgi:glucans biosynthesis protein
MFALLDSPRVSGAYQFDVTPGDETIMDVRTRLYLRAPVATLGVAPLTSMYQFGENQPHRVDFRPEVHDSDGLMVATGDGEWLWRPLINRANIDHVVCVPDLRLRPVQRDRSFASYSSRRVTTRPSAWSSRRPSGPGRVGSCKSTPERTDDSSSRTGCRNIAGARQTTRFAYRLHWQGARVVQQPPGAWVTQSRVGRGYRELADDEHQFIVDFVGPSVAALPSSAPVRAVVSAPANGEILETNAYYVEATGAWRLMVLVRQLDLTKPIELRGICDSRTSCGTWLTSCPH